MTGIPQPHSSDEFEDTIPIPGSQPIDRRSPTRDWVPVEGRAGLWRNTKSGNVTYIPPGIGIQDPNLIPKAVKCSSFSTSTEFNLEAHIDNSFKQIEEILAFQCRSFSSVPGAESLSLTVQYNLDQARLHLGKLSQLVAHSASQPPVSTSQVPSGIMKQSSRWPFPTKF